MLSCRPAEVRLVSEHDKEFCLLAVSSVLNHPRRDLAAGDIAASTAESREEPIATITAMPAAMNKKKQSRARNRDDPDVRFGLGIMDGPEALLYPKTAQICQHLALSFRSVSSSVRRAPAVVPCQLQRGRGIGVGRDSDRTRSEWALVWVSLSDSQLLWQLGSMSAW